MNISPDLSLHKLCDLLISSDIPDKETYIDNLKHEIIEMMTLNALGKNYEGDLDYPPEILVNIFNSSGWNLELRTLIISLYNFYNRYLNFKIKVTNEEDLGYLRIILLI